MPAFVLDSYAILAFLQDEKGAHVVEDLILSAQEEQNELLMSVVNLGEVWYAIARSESVEVADFLVEQIRNLPIEFVQVDWALASQAARFKLKGNIAYADCFAAALAKLRQARVVSGDREFTRLADEVELYWIQAGEE